MPGITVVKFTIQRDGTLTDITFGADERLCVSGSERPPGRSNDSTAPAASRGISKSDAHRPSQFPVSTMTHSIPAQHPRRDARGAASWPPRRRRRRRRPSQATSAPRISGEPGRGTEVRAARRSSRCRLTRRRSPRRGSSTNVLWDDLNFEREFSFIPRDVYATIPAAKSLDDVPLERWHELNADGVIAGTVQKSGAGFLIQRAHVRRQVAARGVRLRVHRLIERAGVRPRDLGRDLPEAARASRRGAHEAGISESTATASGWRARSKTATSGKSTSPITTARASAG